MGIENIVSVRMAIGRAEMKVRKMILSFSSPFLEHFQALWKKGCSSKQIYPNTVQKPSAAQPCSVLPQNSLSMY